MENEPVPSLGLLIHDAARAVQKRFEARASGHNLSAAQWRLLARLVKAEGAPQARLADLMEIEPISVSRLLDRMEDGGWIERRPDPADRRVRMVFPTARGRQVFAEIKQIASEIYEEALAGLPPGEREVLYRGLRTLIDNLSSDAASTDEGKAAATGAN